MNDLLEEAKQEQRADLEAEARKAIELRTQLPALVENGIRADRERIAVELAERSELSHREIGEIVAQSAAWVSRVVAESKGGSDTL